MKKIKILFFLFILAALTSPAFALTCKNGNDASDECWTDVNITSGDKAIIAGTVLVYDFITPTQQSNTSDNAAFYVRAATSADQSAIVAGVAQRTLSSNDRASIMVRGKGKIKVESTSWTSGDRLYLKGNSTSGGRVGTTVRDKDRTLDSVDVASNDKAIAFALSSATAAATTDAFIVIV